MSLNTGFVPLTIAEVRRETADAVSIRFDMPQNLREQFAFRAGQHLTLRAQIDGEDVRRTYSLCVAPSEGEWRIAIKQMPLGKFSGWANSALRAGRTIDALPPMGRFVLQENGSETPRYIALAGGSGITPVISIVKTALSENTGCTFTLLYGNRDTASIIFLEELAALKNRYMDRLEVFHFLENEAEEIELFNGRLDRAKCDEVFSSLVDVTDAAAFFICGPGPMMDAAEGALRARNVSADKIFIERFTTGEIPPEQVARIDVLRRQAAGTLLTVVLDGRRSIVQFDAAKGSILECVQAAGLPAPYACKGGVCTTCRAKIISGSATMRKNYGLTEQETTQGYVLTCQAVPTSGELSLSYDA